MANKLLSAFGKAAGEGIRRGYEGYEAEQEKKKLDRSALRKQLLMNKLNQYDIKKVENGSERPLGLDEMVILTDAIASGDNKALQGYKMTPKRTTTPTYMYDKATGQYKEVPPGRYINTGETARTQKTPEYITKGLNILSPAFREFRHTGKSGTATPVYTKEGLLNLASQYGLGETTPGMAELFQQYPLPTREEFEKIKPGWTLTDWGEPEEARVIEALKKWREVRGRESMQAPGQSGVNATGIGRFGMTAPKTTSVQRQLPIETENDPIVRTGTDRNTGRRVGMTRSGKMVELSQ